MPRRRLNVFAPIGLAAVMLAAGALAASAHPRVPQRDHIFADEAAGANLGEISEARLALAKTNEADVDRFAHRMIHDHGMANAQLKKIAEAQNIKLPTVPPANGLKQAHRLQKLEGAAFIRAYIRDQIADHQKVIAMFQRESRTGRDYQLKNFASDTLPILRTHLRLARALKAKEPAIATTGR
ncbi:MAG: DUF4142 domain-containing protein [Stellaceae bacterium]